MVTNVTSSASEEGAIEEDAVIAAADASVYFRLSVAFSHAIMSAL